MINGALHGTKTDPVPPCFVASCQTHPRLHDIALSNTYCLYNYSVPMSGEKNIFQRAPRQGSWEPARNGTLT